MKKIRILTIRRIALLFFAFSITAFATAEPSEQQQLKQAQLLMEKHDFNAAFQIYKQLADNKHPLGEFNVGLFYQQGWERNPNAKQACMWFERAANNGVPAAKQLLANCYVKGSHKPTDYASAAHWYEEAARDGIHSAWCSLGDLYIQGNGVQKNVVKGLQFCVRAAQSGDAQAAWRAAKLYLDGKLVPKDIEIAAALLPAAAAVVPEAGFRLGKIFLDTKQAEQARFWFESAAALGYAPAYLPTAQLYFSKRDNPEALAKAYLWVKSALAHSSKQQQLSERQHLSEQQHDAEQQHKSSEKLLTEINKIMPESWHKSLDQTVAAHLQKFSKG